MQYAVDSGSLTLPVNASKTCLRLVAASNVGFVLTEFSLMLDAPGAFLGGGTGTGLLPREVMPMVLELASDDGITGGTATTLTPAQVRGGAAASTVTAAHYMTAEPTFTNRQVLKRWIVRYGDVCPYRAVAGREPSPLIGSALSLRIVTPIYYGNVTNGGAFRVNAEFVEGVS